MMFDQELKQAKEDKVENLRHHPALVTNNDLIRRLNELSDAVTKGRSGMSEFTMRVPAEPKRDADLVLSEAAIRLDRYQQSSKTAAEYMKAIITGKLDKGSCITLADAALKGLEQNND